MLKPRRRTRINSRVSFKDTWVNSKNSSTTKTNLEYVVRTVGKIVFKNLNMVLILGERKSATGTPRVEKKNLTKKYRFKRT